MNGAVSVFLCSNLGNGPAGTQFCPPPRATVEGTITAGDVIGPVAQGIAPGELDELMRAIRAGVTRADVHSSKFAGGEIGSQLRAGRHGGGGRWAGAVVGGRAAHRWPTTLSRPE